MLQWTILRLVLFLWIGPLIGYRGDQLLYPFPEVYPIELGGIDSQTHLTEYFQFHKSTMAFARVYFRPYQVNKNSGNVWMTYSRYGHIDFNSLLYRTHGQGNGKGILFHFTKGCINQHDTKLAHLMQAIDFPNNIYRFPVVDGPGGGGHEDFLPFAKHFEKPKMNNMNAKFAVGFADVIEHTDENIGYTQEHVQSLQNYTRDLCVDPYTNLYVAFNAFLVGQSKSDVKFNFYPNFRLCRLLLYNMPKALAVNVRRVRAALLDHVNFDRMQVIMPGRSITQRLVAQHNVAWSYSLGHHFFPAHRLPIHALLEIFDTRATLIRLFTYKLTEFEPHSPLKTRPSYFFRPMTESELRRRKFDVEHLPYLAQVDDYDKVIVLRPQAYDHWEDMMKFFAPSEDNYENSHLPFMEAYIFRGPNGDCNTERDVPFFFKTLNSMKDTILTQSRFLLGFCENHGEYNEFHMSAALEALQKHAANIRNAQWGLMLEVSSMSGKAVVLAKLREILKIKGCEWVFLKDDHKKITKEMLEKMREWLPVLDEQIIFLMFNDEMYKVNMFYEATMRKEPPDLSNVEVTTLKPTTTTKKVGTTMAKPTTLSNSRIVWETTTPKPEPLATVKNNFTQHKNKGQLLGPLKVSAILGAILFALVV